MKRPPQLTGIRCGGFFSRCLAGLPAASHRYPGVVPHSAAGDHLQLSTVDGMSYTLQHMAFTISQRQHLAHAAIIWSIGGTILAVRGTSWILTDDWLHPHLLWTLAVSLTIGLLKGGLVMTRSARRVSARIDRLGERSPAWRLFSRWTYLLIVVMIGAGFLIRWAGRHWHAMGLIGVVYLAVGVALLAGSLYYWRERAALTRDASGV